MAILLSPNKTVHCLQFRPFPRKPVSLRVVSDGRVLYAISRTGSVYTTEEHLTRKNRQLSPLRSGLSTDHLMAALVALSRITQADADEHLKFCAEYRRRREANDILDYHLPTLTGLGIKLTKADLKIIKSIRDANPAEERH
jgi:hypothetical protein